RSSLLPRSHINRCRSHSPLAPSLTPAPPRSPLFPYTTLFRSFAFMIQQAIENVGGLSGIGGDDLGVERRESVGHMGVEQHAGFRDRKSTRLNSSHVEISYAVFCLKKKKE